MDTDLREIKGFIIVDTQSFFLRGSVDLSSFFEVSDDFYCIVVVCLI